MRAINREQVAAFHKALHSACNLPALRPSMGDERIWWDFLLEMAPLSEHESGPFSVADIEGAVREMRREKNDGKAGWSLRPSAILRNPEGFRDMVLLFRTNRRLRRIKERHPTPSTVTTLEQVIEDKMSMDEAAAGFAELRRKLNGGAL